MLGRSISDPLNIESSTLETAGLNLLGVTTEMAFQKTLRQVKLPNNIEGFEIHHGKTSVNDGEVIMSSGSTILGVKNQAGNVWGTYLHGIFDNDQYRLDILNELRQKKDLPIKTTPTIYNIEPALDRLADAVRNSVDMNQIYRLMGL